MVIVSQDKIKTTQRLELYIQRNSDTDEELQFEIWCVGCGSLGGYATEKRAKEVLEDIARFYEKSKEKENDMSSMKLYFEDAYVFRMPEE